jgi:hypothetical protein
VLELPSREDAVEWPRKIAVSCRRAQELREFMYDPASWADTAQRVPLPAQIPGQFGASGLASRRRVSELARDKKRGSIRTFAGNRYESPLSDSNRRPPLYKSGALAN